MSLLPSLSVAVDTPDLLERKCRCCRPGVDLHPFLIAEFVQFLACGVGLKPFPAVALPAQLCGQPCSCKLERGLGCGLVPDQRGADHQGSGLGELIGYPDKIFKDQGIPVSCQAAMGLLIRRDKLITDLNGTREQGQQVLKRRQTAGLQDGRDPSRLDLKQQVSDKRRLEARLTPGDHDLADFLTG